MCPATLGPSMQQISLVYSPSTGLGEKRRHPVSQGRQTEDEFGARELWLLAPSTRLPSGLLSDTGSPCAVHSWPGTCCASQAALDS